VKPGTEATTFIRLFIKGSGAGRGGGGGEERERERGGDGETQLLLHRFATTTNAHNPFFFLVFCKSFFFLFENV